MGQHQYKDQVKQYAKRDKSDDIVRENSKNELFMPKSQDIRSQDNQDQQQTFYSKFLKAKQQLRDHDQQVAQGTHTNNYYQQYQSFQPPVRENKSRER